MHYAEARLTDNRSIIHIGGASFTTIAISERYHFECPFIDYENGTYDVICQFRDNCHNMTITLMHLDYGSYRWNGLLVNQILWQGQICRKTKQKTSCTPYTGWYRYGSKWPWKWMNKNKIVHFLDKEAIRHCHNNKSISIDLIGDSHMRLFLEYWLYMNDYLHKYPQFGRKGQWQTFESKIFNFKYLATSYVLDSNQIHRNSSKAWVTLPTKVSLSETMGFRYFLPAAENWRAAKLAMLSNGTVSNVTWILAAGFGSWDSAFRNISQFVFYSIPALRNFLDAINGNSKLLAATKVVVYNVPAGNFKTNFSSSRHPLKRTELRNDALIAAVNSLIADVVRNRPNVKLVDFYAITLPRKTEAVDRVHYLKFDSKGTKVIGSEPGITAANLVLSNVCEDFIGWSRNSSNVCVHVNNLTLVKIKL